MTAVANPERRRLLQRGLFGTALLALGGGSFLALRRGPAAPPPPTPLRFLDEREYAVVYALAARMVQPGRGFPSADEVQVALTVDRVFSRLHPADASELKQLLRLFDNALAGFLFGRRGAPFTALGPQEQDAVLREWQDSRLVLRRTGFQALRTLLMAIYYGSPKVWGAMGYPGPPQGFHDPSAPAWRGGGVPRPPGGGAP